jgi:hypothetical protein
VCIVTRVHEEIGLSLVLIEDRGIGDNAAGLHKTRETAEVVDVLRRRQPGLVVLCQSVYGSLRIDRRHQSRSWIGFSVVEACNALPPVA